MWSACSIPPAPSALGRLLKGATFPTKDLHTLLLLSSQSECFWAGLPGIANGGVLFCMKQNTYFLFPSAWVYDLAALSRREAGKAHFEIVTSVWADWIQFWIQMSRNDSLGFCFLFTEARCDAPLKGKLIMIQCREQEAGSERRWLSRRNDDFCQAPPCTLEPGQESESCSSSTWPQTCPVAPSHSWCLIFLVHKIKRQEEMIPIFFSVILYDSGTWNIYRC